MQRLFTTFPNSWPGAGLLILRLTLAGQLPLHDLSTTTSGRLHAGVDLAETLVSIMLIGGLWTPLAALWQAGMTALLIVQHHHLRSCDALVGLASISLAMLGPGAWSADSLVFGRKRIEIQRP